jgi:hypothetical protein
VISPLSLFGQNNATISIEQATLNLPFFGQAMSASISFKKECSKQMVTVCLPQHYPQQPYGYGKGKQPSMYYLSVNS